MNEFWAPVAVAHLRREREKARELRASQWWKRRIEAGICHYCHARVGRRVLTMDHVVPLGRGGRSIRGNVVPACKACNNLKKSLVPVEWQAYLDRLQDGSRD
jgi:5-methylcytosine-specific restriction enzyme A